MSQLTWSDIAGILGFLLSLVHAFVALVRSRECFTLSILDYADFGSSTRFMVCISNLSSSPLCISSITYGKVLCELEPKMVRNNPGDWNFASTPRFPLCIPAHSSSVAYLEFVSPRHKLLSAGMQVSFQIRTTSHLVWKTALLGNRDHYLNKTR